jgi:hypothetical protein
MKQRKISKRTVIGSFVIVVLTASMMQPLASARAAPSGPAAVIAWNAITLRALITVTRHTFRQMCITLWIHSKVNTSHINRILDRAQLPRLMRLPQLPPTMCWLITSRHSNLHWIPTIWHFEPLYQTGLQNLPEFGRGSEAATELIALRQNDGLYANREYPG